ncbi:dolichyl-phosphate-mannose--protein mannosyltransferase [Veillonella denticariosi JCM 15641]|uniref:Dolichyl-phosphate-mannose--protein mannosyltransferase n=1 Tax=Veillonella denticariosi JCM 15641 TaxID=1298594 RepID=A0A2S7ZAH5_9FIRM|nr:glycosyltransferase family 39 protein [Veillonella denticariosi]PQL20263.1 dolichyl-phosphate-mannose--protein mannosyltransferase [Veillonella denticariosi JCM 15641]
MKLSRLTPVVFIVWLVFYMVGNNILPVTDPVESNYALTAKEMVLSGNWLSPQIYGTYWYDKPIMIYWLIALGFKLFGIADWVVRLPSTLFGALSVATMYQAIHSMSGRWVLGLIAASVLGSSLMFWTVAHGVVTDMVLLYTTLMIMIYAYKGLVLNRRNAMIVAYAFAALGVLTKGPVAIVLPGIILLIYAAIYRSGTMLKRIFDWRGILVFCAIALPWYAYMYSVHGQAFIDGFLGLHNVTRATQSEHPEDNVWWYYIAIFLGASLPWTGAVIYGIISGYKQRRKAYVYCLAWGLGTILFYTLMATKYPLYTFVSLIPVSAFGAMGVMKAVRAGRSRVLPWIIIGPTLLLWLSYVVASFFAPWGFYYLLYVVVAVSVLLVLHAWYTHHRYRLVSIIVLGTMVISSIVLMEGVEPLFKQRSSIDVVPVVDSYDGDVYYYNGYSTAVVYYTGHKVVKINGDESRWDDQGKLKKRSAEWQKKYLMQQVSEKEFIKILSSGKPLMLIVPKGEIKHFRQSSIYPYVSEYSEAGTSEVYILNKQTLFH